MSHFDHNPNALPYPSPGSAPVLEGVASSAIQRPAPFSQPAIPQAGGPSGPPAINFQVVRSLRMHRKLAIFVGVSICLVLVALGLEQPQTYTASSVIYVEPMVARNLNEQGVPGFDQFRYGSFLEQQMQTIVRPDVLTAALNTLPSGTWRGPLESEQSAVARLSKALTVERASTSYQITVELKTSNPEKAAAIVNAVTTAYLQRGREDEFKQADLREQILSEERDRVSNELAIDRKEQASLGASMGLANPADGAGNPYDADLTNLRSQLDTARQARDVAAAQLESVTGQDDGHQSGLTASADDLINTDAGLSAKKSAVNARRVVLESMMAGITPNNPQYRQAQDEIADLDRSLEAKTAEVRQQAERRIQDKLRTDLQRTAEVESKINAQLSTATFKATGAGPKLQRAAELASDIQRLTARYATVDEALHALQVETSGPGMSHVPLPATVPLSPDPNRRNLFFMAAFPLGLLFGVTAAVVARLSDRRIYLGSDLQQAIGFAPIAVLPARQDVSARVADEYVLRLGAGVESAYRSAGAKSFVLTSVSPDTETGTLLRELSAKLESLRLRVHLVHASELLATSQQTMEHQVASAALAASGAVPFVLLAKDGIGSDKLDRMKAQTDIILIDAAPLLHSAETEYAARCADATILVVESAVTQTTELAAATSLLSQLRVTGVGAVLDQLKLEQADDRFRRAVHVIEQRSQHRSIKPQPDVPQDAGAPVASAEPATPFRQASAEVVVEEEVPYFVEPLATQASPLPSHGVSPSVEAVPPALDEADSFVPQSTLDEADSKLTFAEHTEELAFASSPLLHFESEIATPSAIAALEPSATEDPQPPSEFPSFVAEEMPALPLGISVPQDTWVSDEIHGSQYAGWSAEAHTSEDEFVNVTAQPGTRSRFALLGSLADSAPVAQSSSWTFSAPTSGDLPHEIAASEAGVSDPSQPLSQRAALHAASAKLERALASSSVPSNFAGDAAVPGDDNPNAVGRFVGQKDTMEAVPPYTQSRIRLAFKEQEVNSKTTWFSKLFRGEPAVSFRLVEDEAAANNGSTGTPKPQWNQPLARLPEPVIEDDPELSHLLNRIRSSVETKVVPQSRPVAVETEPIIPPAPPMPFFERRSEPRPVETDEDHVPTALAPVAAASPTPLTHAAEFTLAPPAAALAVSEQRSEGGPLRPLTFHELSGSIEVEPVWAEVEPVEQPVFEEQTSAEAQVQGSVASASELELPAIFQQLVAQAGASTPVALPTFDSLGQTDVPMWPAHESPVRSSNASLPPEQNKPESALRHQFASSDVVPFASKEPSPEALFSDRQAASRTQFIAPLPVARLESSSRLAVVAEPQTDPSPSQRSYRVETGDVSSERRSASESLDEQVSGDLATAEPIAAETSFPPDSEVRAQTFGRRKSDQQGDSGAPSLTRHWKLLSQFEPIITDPLPANRRGYTRSTDPAHLRASDEG